MWRRTQFLLALESFSFTLLNFFLPVSGECNDEDDGDVDDDDFDGVDGSCFFHYRTKPPNC